ncbi:MAG TPA: FAD-dependent oxidoreductase [Burkholderiales bacterium]|nr:FAD-dependent oxidoreductase [Burkholderiales bacterium]
MKRILLIGAGHAHLVVLRSLAKNPLYGARITLLSPNARQLYSGMLPGLIAGHYRLEETEIDVERLAARAFAEFIPDELASLDADRRLARVDRGGELAYDLVSLNVGSRVERSMPGAEYALPAKPFEAFLLGLEQARPARVAIAGAGAAGMELAMALRYRGANVTLYSKDVSVSPEAGRRAARALRRAGVDFRHAMPMDAIEPGPVVISGSSRQEFDLVVLTTGAAALPWQAASGLATDEAGFIVVGQTLQSVSHPEVFAAGDCAALPGVPKSGAYAVRQGEVLADALRAVVEGRAPADYRPQASALVLLSCGRKYAIAQRGAWSAEGRLAWHWKNRIDRGWVNSFCR